MSRYISTQRQNKAKKTPEVEEAREGKPHNRVKQAPPRPDRGCHHGPWWSPRAGHGAHYGGCPVVSLCAAFWSFGVSHWVAGFCLFLGLLDLLAIIF